ncbi:hypothetical protein B5X24_HaOG200643 [Helicoverpa armigera]|nr:hypothetical protein B5X24_HaOG200643 [Helicoverpa armigera]
MFKLCVVLAFIVATCHGGTLERTSSTCGQVPRELTACLDLQPAVSPEIQEKCRRSSECERLTCVFREYNLLDGAEVNKERTAAFLDNFVKQYPSWEVAIDVAKTSCLRSSGLKPQGVFLDCPAYDIIQCVFANLVKNALPSQWSSMSQCNHAREFAAACPICPDACFAPLVPIGTCNACSAARRTS